MLWKHTILCWDRSVGCGLQHHTILLHITCALSICLQFIIVWIVPSLPHTCAKYCIEPSTDNVDTWCDEEYFSPSRLCRLHNKGKYTVSATGVLVVMLHTSLPLGVILSQLNPIYSSEPISLSLILVLSYHFVFPILPIQVTHPVIITITVPREKCKSQSSCLWNFMRSSSHLSQKFFSLTLAL